jgi:hypothetical protein
MKHTIDTAVRSLGLLLLAVIALGLTGGAARAQLPHDTKGTKFWVTFMHNDGNSPVSDLRLYLAGEVPTRARLIYHLTGDTVVVPLPIAKTTVEVNINNIFGNQVEMGISEELATKGIEVLADDDITLYGININSKSADAFLGLPDDVLTSRYIVLAYPNGFQRFDINSFDEPSEFAIVGTEDGTSVNIALPFGTSVNGRAQQSFTIALNKGQVFFAHADLIGEEDVSGTEIVSNKPVAVFGGHARTSIPNTVGNFRDHLVEQMPPLDAWGKEAVTTPFYPITPDSPFQAEARVLAAFDNTRWSLDGVPQGTLTRGVPHVIRPLGAHVITADQPILVAQYDHSVGISWDANDQFPKDGDPFMTLIPPSEQFDTAYPFQCVIHPEFDDTAHFCNVVIPTTSTATLAIDGKSDPNWKFKPITGSRFSYAQIRVSPGAHYIRASEPFGLYVYGYGAANSYGYNGGMLFRTLVNDFQPPQIALQSQCDSITGIAFDSRITDTGVDSLYQTSDTKNAVVTIDKFTPPQDTVGFHARLINPYQDGQAGIKAIDSGGRSFTRVIGIAGFTLGAVDGTANADSVRVDTVLSFNGKQSCQMVTIRNYGKYPQVIRRMTLLPDMVAGASVDGGLPLTIPPGETRTVRICYNGTDDTVIYRTLQIEGDCIDRSIAVAPLLGVVDTVAPSAIKSSLACHDDFEINFSDESKFGYVTVAVDTIINGDLVAGSGPSDIRIHWRDRHYDLIYRVHATDRAGNVNVEADTLAGFTVAALDPVGDTVSVSTGRTWQGQILEIGVTRCDSVTLANFGTRRITVADARLFGNASVSIPPTQFPLTIEPGEQRKLEICFARLGADSLSDTLLLFDSCGTTVDRVALSTPTGPFSVTGANCRSHLDVTFYGPAKRTFLMTPAPNPVSGGSAIVDIGLTARDVVTIELLDGQGNHAMDVARDEDLPEGISRLSFDVSALTNGAYFCRLTTSSGEQVITKMVVRH